MHVVYKSLDSKKTMAPIQLNGCNLGKDSWLKNTIATKAWRQEQQEMCQLTF